MVEGIRKKVNGTRPRARGSDKRFILQRFALGPMRHALITRNQISEIPNRETFNLIPFFLNYNCGVKIKSSRYKFWPIYDSNISTISSRGPCTPKARVISMSAVLEGPDIKTTLVGILVAHFSSCIASKNELNILSASRTAM